MGAYPGMKENVLDVLMYLFETYVDTEEDPEPDQNELRIELSKAGFGDAEIDRALELYDSVVLPMRLNEDLEFLEKIGPKDRIVLFANAGCALTCMSNLCYKSISTINKGKGGKFECSQPIKDRDLFGMVRRADAANFKLTAS